MPARAVFLNEFGFGFFEECVQIICVVGTVHI